MSEAKLKSYLMQMLSSHFQIRPEVEGTFIPYGTKVILNYLMYPKPHLIERGFDPVWFGVEVKWPGGRGGGNPKGLRIAYQAITYHWSEFDGEMPAFVVIYPGPDEFFGRAGTGYLMACLLQKANVGYFVFNKRKRSWRIRMGSVSYFDSRWGRSKTANALLKRNSGSWT